MLCLPGEPEGTTGPGGATVSGGQASDDQGGPGRLDDLGGLSGHRPPRVTPRAPRPTPPVHLTVLAARMARDPLPYYRQLREGPALVREPGSGTWLLSRYADVRAALAEPRLVPHGPPRAPWPTGTPSARPLAEAVERAATVLVRRLAGRPEADLVTEFCDWLPAVTLVTALGLPYGQAARIQPWCRAGSHRCDGLADFLRPHLEQRRRRPGRDWLSHLVTPTEGATGRPEPTDAQLTLLLAELLRTAGADTARGLAALLAALLGHPDRLGAVRARPELLDAAWTETLRHSPPAPFVALRVTGSTPLRLPGGGIPGGAWVLCLRGAAGRDPGRFADPDRFDLFRPDPADPAAPIGPGAGPGEELGRLQARHGLAPLLDGLPALRLAPGFRPRPVGLLHRSPRTLRVRTDGPGGAAEDRAAEDRAAEDRAEESRVEGRRQASASRRL